MPCSKPLLFPYTGFRGIIYRSGVCLLLYFLAYISWCPYRATAFLIPNGKQQQNADQQQQQQQQLSGRAVLSPKQRRLAATATDAVAAPPATNGDKKVVDVVLFGVGDFRVQDHLGLQNALDDEQSKILPVVWWNDDMIMNLPGVVAHTVDTVQMWLSSVQSLQDELLQTINLDLHVIDTKDDTTTSGFLHRLQQLVGSQGTAANTKFRIHVCDLGPVDNAMGYGPYGHLMQEQGEEAVAKNNDGIEIDIVPWNSFLRDEPWKDLNDNNFPTFYPQYESRYTTDNKLPKEPVSIPKDAVVAKERQIVVSSSSSTQIPDTESLLDRFIQVLNLDKDQCQAESNTGLFATHWGGLPSSTIGCQCVEETLQAYATECQEEDKVWSQHPKYPLKKCRRNGRSLEHAAMTWQLMGDGTSFSGKTENWLAGESMVRYLAAPLLYGTVSPRNIWQLSKQDGYVYFSSPIQKLVEGREWHQLLAAALSKRSENEEGGVKRSYKYWRYHGFLCRYAETNMPTESISIKEEGILLIHGFGASGTQWNKAMDELRSQDVFDQGLAPDQLGFGHAEKPALSYSGYLWDSQMMDFVKEVALHKNRWQSYVVGGNSIGGFTSMALAACDRASGTRVSSSGSPGTSRCSGVVLMNSAGPVKSREEIEKELQNARELQLESVAQVTALEGLPPCKPPPRPVGRLFGNALLGYLRPRIQSICQNLYPTNPAAVDEALCESIERDSLDPGAINVMISGAKLPPPRTANELLAADFGAAHPTEGQVLESTFDGPVLIAQGVLDPLNDAMDRMNRYQALRNGIEVSSIKAGHCPHDELPDQVAKSIATWRLSTRRAMTAVSSPRPMDTAAPASRNSP